MRSVAQVPSFGESVNMLCWGTSHPVFRNCWWRADALLLRSNGDKSSQGGLQAITAQSCDLNVDVKIMNPAVCHVTLAGRICSGQASDVSPCVDAPYMLDQVLRMIALTSSAAHGIVRYANFDGNSVTVHSRSWLCPMIICQGG